MDYWNYCYHYLIRNLDLQLVSCGGVTAQTSRSFHASFIETT